MEILILASCNRKVKVYNDNTTVIDTVNSKLSFKEVVGEHGQEKSNIWTNCPKFQQVTAEWSKDESKSSQSEHERVQKLVQQCHKLAHEQMECEYNETDLGVTVHGSIECGKLGTIARKLIGMQYITEHLKKKY